MACTVYRRVGLEGADRSAAPPCITLTKARPTGRRRLDPDRFEWPRESSGEAVADSLGVTLPTVHQHRRTAEPRLLATPEGETTDDG